MINCTYSPALSKNARIAQGKRRFFIKPEAKAAEARLEREMCTALKGLRWYNQKVYLDIYVYKSRTNTDAINFIDVLADCLKRVIMVDDRWFCIKSLDWELDRVNPRIVLRLYQPERRNG